MKLLTTILGIGLLSATTAFACEDGHRGELRKFRKSGELTKEERQALREDFKKHKELRESLKADGSLSEEDRAKLKENREAMKKHLQELASNDQKRQKKEKKQ